MVLPGGLRAFAAAAVFALCAATGRAADPPPAAQSAAIERTPEFVERVNQAIDAGVAWLDTAAGASGEFPAYPAHPCGVQALAYHTLRICGVPRDAAPAKRTWEALRRTYAKSGRGELQTYTAALLLMAIAEHGERVKDPNSDREVKLSDADRAWADEVLRWLERAQNDDGTWTYGVANSMGPAARIAGRLHDHSNTQYAVLGLKAAARCGLAIESKVWLRALQHFLDVQEKNGPEVVRRGPTSSAKGATAANTKDRARGWGYVGSDTAYGSMTAGGVGSVVICRSELLGTRAMTAALDAASETSVRDGLAWLGRAFNVRTNPGPRGTMAGPRWHYYWLYAVERAGVLAAVERMGEHDWYGEGAEYLCDAQAANGGWNSLAPPGRRGDARAPAVATAANVVDTCFALLFLKKGTMPVRRGALTQAADDSDIRFDRVAALTGQDFEDFLDIVLQRWRRSSDADVRRRLFERATAIGPRIVEPLLRRLDSADADDRVAAHALLVHATGKDFRFDAAAGAGDREAAVLAWQAWWLVARDRVAYDAAAKRISEPAR